MGGLLTAELERILAETPELKGAYLVGGCVRDWLLGLPPEDIDIEVFGLTYEQLAAALSRWGATDVVGRSFGVVKLRLAAGQTYDFSIPRRESKTGPGHTGFRTSFDPAITPEEAAARRDYTLNALMYDPRARQVLDFFGGESDLRQRVLRHTSAAFVEDPLRVLRGMQLAGRFNLTAAPQTVALCREIRSGFTELAVERVREEWFKWAAKSQAPSAGLRFLAATGWVEHFPELAALIGVPQDPEWHPEGDVFAHTCHCCDALAQLESWRAADETSRVVYLMAVLAHDFGKPATTREEIQNGRTRIVSPGHEPAGGLLAEAFLERIGSPGAIIKRVVPLVKNHLAHLQTINERFVRRLARRLEPETIEGLCLVITADAFGRPPRPPVAPPGLTELQKVAAQLKIHDSAPKPILQGRHLVAAGRLPGPEFSRILHAAYEAQLDGHFTDLPGALLWLKQQDTSGARPGSQCQDQAGGSN
jgi:tRNA nucleotidyltransferase (CCA-adding enzyme)